MEKTSSPNWGYYETKVPPKSAVMGASVPSSAGILTCEVTWAIPPGISSWYRLPENDRPHRRGPAGTVTRWFRSPRSKSKYLLLIVLRNVAERSQESAKKTREEVGEPPLCPPRYDTRKSEAMGGRGSLRGASPRKRSLTGHRHSTARLSVPELGTLAITESSIYTSSKPGTVRTVDQNNIVICLSDKRSTAPSGPCSRVNWPNL